MDLLEFYSRWMFSQISSVSWCSHCFVWGRGALTVDGVIPKPGSVGDIRRCKISLSAMQIAICQKRPTFRISIFSLLQMAPLLSAARGKCPPSPSPSLRRHWHLSRRYRWLVLESVKTEPWSFADSPNHCANTRSKTPVSLTRRQHRSHSPKLFFCNNR